MTEVRSPQRKLVPDTVGPGDHERTSLWGIAKRVRACKDHRFQDLYRLLDAELLHASWRDLNKKAAAGVDGVAMAVYEEDLDANIGALVERLKTKRYRTRRVRRCYIPKEDGGERPLGIPAVEDRLVQAACARILTAIYEADFLDVSYGYRPGKSAKDAVADLGFNLHYGKFGHVVEADNIKGYCDAIDDGWLLEMLSLRMDDGAFLGLIRQWLQAGGNTGHGWGGPAPGDRQPPGWGGLAGAGERVSAHALDLWFERVVKPRCRGQALLVRYADDDVCAFQFQEDAQRFYRVVARRLGRFGPQVAPEKTRLMRFSRFHPGLRRRFAFLGFELYWNRDRRGELRVMKRTARKKLQAAKRRLKGWIRAARHLPGRVFIRELNRRLVGHYNYFGLRSNEQGLRSYYIFAIRCAFKWLNRRGGKRSSFNWTQYIAALRKLGVAQPRITERQRAHTVFA
ncbi:MULTISPECIES: reverse transcriptase domain-containing protein [Halorhodospira]|uniref:reverse transcriptase domain-containing protein n=1 Tax=Halorhodospira TaxID=85108 RepID=UPI001EE7E819|nr:MULTISPECIES: reverse transcriptase domain-containing protein [Halorhodospira]MCG5529075.1 group II intron reverse transcriptase/maturase [Halorhodospira halophila]MCG5543190.1 group II intron reverse transcriptase/maturase [Halorhodospira sp. 9628]